MSKHINPHFRDTKLPFQSIKDFNHSIDVKRFSKERINGTPTHIYSSFHHRIQQRSNDKIRHSQPSSLGNSFAKNISQKNMKTKRKLSSGFQIFKTNHHSVSIDHHLLKEKYSVIQELFENQQSAKVISMARHSIPHFEHSKEQQNLYYWMAISLGRLQRFQEAVEEISQCLDLYPSFQDGMLLASELHLKLKQYKAALERAQDAIVLNSKVPECYLQQLFVFAAMKQYEKQRQILEPLIDKFPKQPMFLMLLLQCCISMGKTDKCEHYVRQVSRHYSRKDSIYLYCLGLIEKINNNNKQAYILFEQSLKYNNNKIGVNRSLLQRIKIQIQNRDFYQAYHSVGRIKRLQLQQSQQIKVYTIFIEGVMTMMKKKSQEAIIILNKICTNRKCQELQIQSLVYKYMAYGYFKLQQYSKAIKFYQKIPSKDADQSSLYNRLLAQGIQLCDQQYRFQESIHKFKEAANVYPQKVEPYIYTAMTLIHQFNHSKSKDEIKRAEVLIEALKQMQMGSRLNPNSSNLLYHRTIIHIYFEDWKQAHDDINRCIEKAEQNLPKYFYLRGVCYSCIKDFKKAINQFSICLSLDPNFQQAHFEKAKCFFLLGNTEKGFSSLKAFIQLNPDDLTIYKWIGDLLYEGKSFKDALKSYAEYKGGDLDTIVMRAKCLMRVGTIQEVAAMLKLIEKVPNVQKTRVFLDNTAFSLLGGLLKGQSGKVIVSGIHKLNKLLEENHVGYIFQLIDCMNLLGVASFYIHKYNDAYESFLLVLELYQSLCQKESTVIRAEECQEELDLRSEDIYFNVILSEFSRGHVNQALKMIDTEYVHIVSDSKQKKKIEKLLALFDKSIFETFDWDFKSDRPINSKLKKIQIDCGKIKIKTKPVYNLYHENADNLYASVVADKIIKKLHAGYIDTMPQGPWIKRNPYGVVFTDEVMPSENSISLEDTFRQSQSEITGSKISMQMREDEQSSEKKTISKKEQFLRKMQFDSAVEQKLNKLMKNSKQTE